VNPLRSPVQGAGPDQSDSPSGLAPSLRHTTGSDRKGTAGATGPQYPEAVPLRVGDGLPKGSEFQYEGDYWICECLTGCRRRGPRSSWRAAAA